MCKDCKYYQDKDTYKGTGFCTMLDIFVQANEYECEEYEEEN